MYLLKQQNTLPIKNISENLLDRPQQCRHGPLLPSSIRCIITGPSNCGKTNVIISLLESANGLRFENIYLYSKSLFQAKYEYLKNLLAPIKGITFNTYNNGNNIIKPEHAKPNSIIIFDDIACENQNVMREYFSMGRHKSVDTFYLAQSYTRVPKHLIRDNVNLLILFPQDRLNLRHIYDEHVNTDMTFNKFIDICSLCWKEKHNFLVIDKDSPIQSGRYRKGFDEYIVI